MDEKRRLSGDELSAQLSSHRRSVTLFKLLTYGSGAAAILMLASGLIPVAVIFLVFALVGGYKLSKHTETLKKLLSENVVSGVLGEVFENVDYDPFGRIPDKLAEGAGMVFPFAYSRIRGSDHIRGVYKGLTLELSDMELYDVQSYYDDETQQWRENEKQVFKGQWLVCDFGKELSGEVHLSENAKKLRRQHKNDSVEMENTAFNDRFLVTAESAQEAYYILTPHMMDYILTAAGRSGGEVYMSFLRGGRLHIAVNTGKDFFELGRSSADIESLRRKFLGQLRWFTDIVDTLRVEDTLYRKETGI